MPGDGIKVSDHVIGKLSDPKEEARKAEEAKKNKEEVDGKGKAQQD